MWLEQFTAALNNWDSDAVEHLLTNADEQQLQALRAADNANGFLGRVLDGFPMDNLGDMGGSMSKNQRLQRFKMANALLDAGCTCVPLLSPNHIGRNVVAALLRFSGEFEQRFEGEDALEVALCQRIIACGAEIDFFRDIDGTPFSLAARLLHQERIHLLAHVPQLRALGAGLSSGVLATVGKLSAGQSFKDYDLELGDRILKVSPHRVHRTLIVLGHYNGARAPFGALHHLSWDKTGEIARCLLQQGHSPFDMLDQRSVLQYWLDEFLAAPSPSYVPRDLGAGQLEVLLEKHPTVLLQAYGNSSIGAQFVHQLKVAQQARKVLYQAQQNQKMLDMVEHALNCAQREVLTASLKHMGHTAHGRKL